MRPETALDIFQVFVESAECQSNKRLVDNLKTVLRKYILPSFGFGAEILRRDLLGCLAKVSLHEFRHVDKIFNQALKALGDQGESISNGSVRNYRSALNRLLQWVRQQPWHFEPSSPASEERAPKMSIGKCMAKCAEDKKQLAEKFEYLSREGFDPYFLNEEELNPNLIEQMSGLQLFWIEPEGQKRKGPAMQKEIFVNCFEYIQIILAWLKNKQQVPIQSLDLALIADLNTLQAFINYGLEEHGKDYRWASDVAKVSMLVTKWLNPHAKHYNFGDIGQVQDLRRYIHELDSKREDIGFYHLDLKVAPQKFKTGLESFRKFWLDLEVPARKKVAISERTFRSYEENVLGFSGWLYNIQGEMLKEISLDKFADLILLKQFIEWGINCRKNGYGWAVNVAYSSMAVAKWLNPQSKSRTFKDIPIIEEIREYAGYLREQNRNEESRQNLDQKRLTFQEAQQVVEYLKQCCAPLDKYGDERSEKAVMSSWQKYLIVSILTYCPVRQREIRELALNQTLFREADGYWVKLTPKNHKAGQKSRKGREYPLPKHLTADLDTWLREWRPKVKKSEQLIFIRMGSNRRPDSLGEPLDAGDMGDLVTSTVHNATAVLFNEPRDTTPHVYRRIAITFQRRYGRPEQKGPMAEMMGHTVEEADRTYNEESGREKAQKAEGWWQLNPQVGSASANNTSSKLIRDGWIEEDQQQLKHLEASPYQNECLKKLRDQAIMTLWALQELTWAEMHRANIGDLIQQNGSHSLAISRLDGLRSRTLPLKKAIAEIINRYLEARIDFGETLTEVSPLLIGIGNRSGGNRLSAFGIQEILKYYFGHVSSIS